MVQNTSTDIARNHLIFWILAFGFFLAFVSLFSTILLPFILGIAIAYLLDPLVAFLGRRKIPRGIAALLILGAFFVFIAALLAIVVPILVREGHGLIEALPGYIEIASDKLAPYIGWMQESFNNGNSETFKQTLQNNISKFLTVGADILGGLANGGQAFAGFISVVVLTPIVSYFMMKEWNSITEWVDHLIPRSRYETIKGLLRAIDKKLAGFVRGQLGVAFILAVIYAFSLTLVGLKFGFLIGLIAGVLSIIPLVGSTIGLFVSVIVAWFQAEELSYVGLIGGIFLVGQFVEGNFLTPKLLGKSVGLHPLWILFALLAGGSLFGIVGMLLAIPVAAVVGVLLGFAITQYKNSGYYEDRKHTKKKNETASQTDTP
ncbi:MAG: AI-2E family transporter [Alphaproteobacteria bacterium CG_4_9_14_3_um_filter_47_13]|nr:MAG: AI-2E family transporter [Alphaproteobacteria bacterium CG_4_9_14_3_um_filter_47_13]